MSQLQESFPTTQLTTLVASTWVIGFGWRFSLMPTCAAFDCRSAISCASQPKPVAYEKLKLRVLPLAIPGPHLAGSTQVLVPPETTFQPWLASSALALAMLNEYGTPCLPFGDRNLVTGTLPTGLTLTEP